MKLAHVPIAAPCRRLTDVIAGHVQVAFADPAASVQLIRDGKLRALGVTSLVRIAFSAGDCRRSPSPVSKATKARRGTSSWRRRRRRAPVVNRLHTELKAVLAAPDLKKQINTLGLIPVETPPVDELRAFVKQQIAFEGKIVRDIGIAVSE